MNHAKLISRWYFQNFQNKETRNAKYQKYSGLSDVILEIGSMNFHWFKFNFAAQFNLWMFTFNMKMAVLAENLEFLDIVCPQIYIW